MMNNDGIDIQIDIAEEYLQVESVEVEIDIIADRLELENIIIIPNTEEQYFKSEKSGYDEIIVKAIQADEIAITPSTEVQIEKGLFKSVTVDAVKGETLNITPTEESQTRNGVFTTVNVDAIQTEEVIPVLDFSAADAIEVVPTTEKYIKKVILNKDVNFIPGIIKKDEVVFGVKGELDVVDTSDATATSEDILKDKTAYINGVKVTGNIELTKEPFPKLYNSYISATGLLKSWSFVVTFDRQYLIYLTSTDIVVRNLSTNIENNISLADNNLNVNFDMISCSIIQDNKIYITLAQTQGNAVGYCLYDLENNTVEKTNTITIDITISKYNRPMLIRYNTIFDKFIHFNTIKNGSSDVSTGCLSIIDITNNTVNSYTLNSWSVYAFIDKYDRFIGTDNSTSSYIWLDKNGNYKTQTTPFSTNEYRNYIYDNGETYAYIPESESFALATIDTENNTITLGELETIKYPDVLPDPTKWEEKRDMIALNRSIFSRYINYFGNIGTNETEYVINIQEAEAVASGKYAYFTNTTFENGNLYYFGNSDEAKIYLQGIDLSEERISTIKIGEDTLYNPIFGD